MAKVIFFIMFFVFSSFYCFSYEDKAYQIQLNYDSITYNQTKHCYVVHYKEYQSDLNPDDTEKTPIVSQIRNKAIGLMMKDGYDGFEVINNYMDILALDPENKYGKMGISYNTIGSVLCMLGDYKNGKKYIEKAVKIEPENQQFRTNLKLCKNIQKLNNSIAVKERINDVIFTLQSIQAYIPQTQNTYQDNNKNYTKLKENSHKDSYSAARAQISRGALKAYSGYIDQLVYMNTYHETQYDESKRINIQNQMRQIRESNNNDKSHIPISKSDWESWDGKKR